MFSSRCGLMSRASQREFTDIAAVSLGAVRLAADVQMIDTSRGAFLWRFTSRFRSRASRKSAREAHVCVAYVT